MPRRSLSIPFDSKGRCRLNVELDDVALMSLTRILEHFRPRGLGPSHSQILRAALIAFEKGKDYSTAVGLPFVRHPRKKGVAPDPLGGSAGVSDNDVAPPSGKTALPGRKGE